MIITYCFHLSDFHFHTYLIDEHTIPLSSLVFYICLTTFHTHSLVIGFQNKHDSTYVHTPFAGPFNYLHISLDLTPHSRILWRLNPVMYILASSIVVNLLLSLHSAPMDWENWLFNIGKISNSPLEMEKLDCNHEPNRENG